VHLLQLQRICCSGLSNAYKQCRSAYCVRCSKPEGLCKKDPPHGSTISVGLPIMRSGYLGTCFALYICSHWWVYLIYGMDYGMDYQLDVKDHTRGVRIGWSMNKNNAHLLCPQVYNNLPGSASSQLDCYTSKVTAIVSVTLTATDIQGADLSEPLVFFWHHHWEGAWNKLATATLSWLSFISDTLSHLALLSRSLGNR